MQTIRLAQRSLAASCLLHVAALAGLAAWSASDVSVRPRFAGQTAAIELVVIRAEPTWSPPSLTFADVAQDEPQVTVRPTTVLIARKHFDLASASHLAPTDVAQDLPRSTKPVELPRAARSHEHLTAPVAARLPNETLTLPRQPHEPRQWRAAAVQPAQAAGTDRVAPNFTSSPPPNYPPVAIANRWEGTVLLRVYVGVDGSVGKVDVARSSGHAILDGAAVNAVRRWRGSPAIQDGMAIATTELLPVRFKLRD